MNIEKCKLADLRLADYNPRESLKPGDSEYEKLKQSIKHFGYCDPLIVNKRNMTICGGHQRYAVLSELGYTEIDCVIVDLDDNDERGLNIALNKISGFWDLNKLDSLIDGLKANDFNLDLTGFDAFEIENLLKPKDIDIDAFFEDAKPKEEKEKKIQCPNCNQWFVL